MAVRRVFRKETVQLYRTDDDDDDDDEKMVQKTGLAEGTSRWTMFPVI